MQHIRDTFKYLEMNKGSLTSGQVDFVRSLKNYFKSHGYLTTIQVECLKDIAKYMKVEVKL